MALHMPVVRQWHREGYRLVRIDRILFTNMPGMQVRILKSVAVLMTVYVVVSLIGFIQSDGRSSVHQGTTEIKWTTSSRLSTTEINWTTSSRLSMPSNLSSNVVTLGAINCMTHTPCGYEEELDLRVIVMSYSRSESLSKCLEHLQHLELDGDTAAVEIWIDQGKDGTYHNATIAAAKEFVWKKGPTRVHLQDYHAGIYGQWIDTWKPKVDSKELAIILEDDIDVSPYAYRWTRAAHQHYGKQTNISGYSLVELDLIISTSETELKRPTNGTSFGAARFGTFGFAPHPDRWRQFQIWFHQHEAKPGFKPYVKDDIFTSWYKIFESRGTEDGMWSMWFLYFTNKYGLYSIYPNLRNYLSGIKEAKVTNSSFSLHRREKGLHFSKGAVRNSSHQLIQSWNDEFIDFPPETPYFSLDGTKVRTRS